MRDLHWREERAQYLNGFAPIPRTLLSIIFTVTPSTAGRRLLKRIWLSHRRLRRPPVDRVDFGDLRRLKPISRTFGFDSGQPIDRFYIERFLSQHAGDIRGRVLEIGDDYYTRRFGRERVVRSDVLDVNPKNVRATIVADLARGNKIPSNAFDCIICTQTLQYIFDVRAAVKTLNRILKPRGVLLATVPGIQQISHSDRRNWNDYWRFTCISMRELFNEAFQPEHVSVEAHGNVLTATAFLHGLSVGELEREELDYHDPDYEMLITVRAVKPDPVNYRARR